MGRIIAVLLGGAVGTLARWAVGQALPPTGGFPYATFAVNVTGAFGLGLASVLLTERLAPSRYGRLVIGTGFFGAYTTFSTMAVDGVRLVAEGEPATAAAYWLASLVVGQMAGVYGIWMGRLRLPRRRDEAAG
jgi:CrcB protein